jgi:ParB family transcriptional regulator, chromosome partitioning protein
MTTSSENAAAAIPEKTTAAGAAAPEKRRALGRGLESLLPAGTSAGRENRAGWGTPTDGRDAHPSITSGDRAGGVPTSHEVVLDEVHAQAARTRRPDHDGVREGVSEIPLSQIKENPYQTRYYFDEEALGDLRDSIKASGVLQPVVVRPKDGHYVLVLGERRLRASKLAGNAAIPAIVRNMSEQQAAEATLVENLQRQDLTCIEQAQAFSRLSQDFKLTQEQIGNRVGLSRESVSNYMRLLKLPRQVQGYMESRAIGFSEARELLKLEDEGTIEKIAERMIKERWPLIRLMDEIEDINIKRLQLPQEKKAGGARWVDPNVRAAQRELETILGVKVKIRDRKGKGTILIEYATLQDYDRVVGMLRGKRS